MVYRVHDVSVLAFYEDDRWAHRYFCLASTQITSSSLLGDGEGARWIDKEASIY